MTISLEDLKKEYPNVYEIISINENDLGFYDIKVKSKSTFFETTILNDIYIVTYPFQKYSDLTIDQQDTWRWKNSF